MCQVEGDVIETGRNLDDSEMAAYRTTFVLTYLFVGTNIIMFLVFMLNKSQVTVTGECFFGAIFDM